LIWTSLFAFNPLVLWLACGALAFVGAALVQVAARYRPVVAGNS
jgi:hypothetical protein